MSLTKTEKKAVSDYVAAKRKANEDVRREAIQTDRLIDTIQKYAFDEKVVCGHTKDGKEKLAAIKMTPTRLKAIQLLLDKSLPDLAAIKHEVEAQNVVFMIDTEFKPEQAE